MRLGLYCYGLQVLGCLVAKRFPRDCDLATTSSTVSTKVIFSLVPYEMHIFFVEQVAIEPSVRDVCHPME